MVQSLWHWKGGRACARRLAVQTSSGAGGAQHGLMHAWRVNACMIRRQYARSLVGVGSVSRALFCESCGAVQSSAMPAQREQLRRSSSSSSAQQQARSAQTAALCGPKALFTFPIQFVCFIYCRDRLA
eukprot:TRINITY_DN1823_c1_g1_i2.p1 TRINITY_DN1823_c1_g1~~TRINITY_DN1823_c1_g1_i2.p1  ORF type:complete len:128 (-),score=17.93 TRINITY_DN1823_c1_g1_i2:226-609(-)